MANTLLSINSSFTLFTQPFYNQLNQCYQNIIMINVIPEGPLKSLVKRIQLPRLSPFQQEGPCNPIQNCGLVLNNFAVNFGKACTSCNYMTPNEIPNLFAFLASNGYQIETQLTNMISQNDVKLTNSRIICFVTYFGNKQPNITYMK
jgi:hypothetical protein